MHPDQYVVVAVNQEQKRYSFSTFHESLEEAKAEAIRLSEKEMKKFLVLKVVGFADKKPQPIEWMDL